jgi:hypothetical protein
MNKFTKLLLASTAAVALLSAPAAFAQTPPIQVQPATPNIAGTSSFWVGQANGATSCNTVSETAAQDTITVTPPPGQFVYPFGLSIQINTDATGSTAVPTLSFTNLGNLSAGLAPFLSLATTLATTGSTNTGGIFYFPPGFKSAAPTTAVTVVPSATLGAHTIVCMTMWGVTGP